MNLKRFSNTKLSNFNYKQIKNKRQNEQNNQMPRSIRSRGWVFTAFTTETKPPFVEEQMKYLIFQREICPTTKKLHWQGYVYFHNKKTLKAAKKGLNDATAHLEKAKGTPQECIAYCSDLTKEGTSSEQQFQYGTKPINGRRLDLESLSTIIWEGASVSDLAAANPTAIVQYSRGLERLESLRIAQQPLISRKELEVIIYWGPTGTGKTTRAITECPNAYIWDGPFKWFQNYNQETELIIEEYDSTVPICQMLRILDKTKLSIEYKGGSTYANWTKVIITSNIDPKDWHAKAKMQHRRALARRITTVIEMTEVKSKRQAPYEPNEIAHTDENFPWIFKD